MRFLRICLCGLLSLPLLGTQGCQRSDSAKGSSGNCDSTTHTCTVHINPSSCGVNTGEDPQHVPLNYKLKWVLTQSTTGSSFGVTFWQYKTPFRDSAGNAQTNVGVGVLSPPLTVDTACVNTGIGCDFPYVVVKGGQKCGDPGVHVDPNAL
jgi:hypothetical protein